MYRPNYCLTKKIEQEKSMFCHAPTFVSLLSLTGQASTPTLMLTPHVICKQPDRLKSIRTE